MRTLHGAKQTMDTAGRQVVATRWLGEDATFASRPWETSPSITEGLKPGDPFYRSKTFPVVWRSKHWTHEMLTINIIINVLTLSGRLWNPSKCEADDMFSSRYTSKTFPVVWRSKHWTHEMLTINIIINVLTLSGCLQHPSKCEADDMFSSRYTVVFMWTEAKV